VAPAPTLAQLAAQTAARPRDAAAWCALGTAQWFSGQKAEGLDSLRRAVACDPDHVPALAGLGHALRESGAGEAEATLRRALGLNPKLASAHVDLGNALAAQRRHAESIECFQAALALRPDWSGCLNNIGGALLGLHRPGEAVPYLRNAVRAMPGNAGFRNMLGGGLLAVGRAGEALASFEAALALDPGHVKARFGAALARLILGDFAGGWPLYEARWDDPEFSPEGRMLGRPLRPGEEVAGKTVWLRHEQGLGDTIQFVRYVPLLRARGARVILQVQAPLLDLLRPLADEADARAEAPADFDVCLPLLSLPWVFGTEPATIPASTPYLHADPGRVAAWRDRLGPRTGPRIGVAWSGNPDHPNDAIRSIPAGAFLDAFPEQAELHAVQTQLREADLAAVQAHPRLRLHGTALADFGDTAALLSLMDLVVCVDTSVAHLAGAMALPAWLLVQRNADFRWMQDRRDSPWYPSMRLYRQPGERQWKPVLAELARDLADAYGPGQSSLTPAITALVPSR
jgi:tetratricopeptide (TPR) repeat protein